MPDSWAKALSPTAGWFIGIGTPNAYDVYFASFQALLKSILGSMWYLCLKPADFNIASKHDTKSAFPALSPIPLIAVLM